MYDWRVKQKVALHSNDMNKPTRPLRFARVQQGFLLLITGAALYLTFLIARPFLWPIVTAALLAVAIQPLFTILLRFIRNRSAAAIVVTLTVFLALLLPTILVVNTLANETMSLYGWLNEQNPRGAAGWSDYFIRLTDRPLGWIEARVGVSRQQLRATALAQIRNMSARLVDWAKSLAVNITATIVDTVIVLFTLFFLLRDGQSILERAGSILPLEPDRYNLLLKTMSDSIVANIYGVAAVSLAQAALGAIGYWIAGLPNVLLWSVLTALASMIPLLGAVAVWGIGVIYLLTMAHWGAAIFLLAYGTAVISMADNIVRPLVLSGRVKMNTLVIFFSLLGGVQAFGIIGLFIGPITISLTVALVKMLAGEASKPERVD
jgi:predicted PurR-regulated permease PerM